MTVHFVHIQTELDSDRDIVVGPYASEEDATTAMNDSLLIQSLCEEGCVECFTETLTSVGADLEHIVPDLADPDHTGRDADES